MRSKSPDTRSTAGTLRPRGFTYIALLAAIIIIGIVLSAAGKYWANVSMREKEKELLFRGDQYRQAIERYYFAVPNVPQYPRSIDDLTAKRYLRRKYKDPITGKDFVLFRDVTKGNRITGVYSSSDREPIKQSGFSDEDKDFEGKKMYNEWKFIFSPPQVPAGTVPAQTGAARSKIGGGPPPGGP